MANLLEDLLYQISQTDMEQESKQKESICRTLETMTDEEIISVVGMGEMPKIIYLLSLKYQQTPLMIPIENDLMIRVGECNAANFSYLAIYIHFLKIENDELLIEGNISVPVFASDNNRLCIKCNDIMLPAEMQDCGMDCKLGENIYEKRTVFKVCIPLQTDENEIVFDNVVNGLEWHYGKINSMRFAPISDCISKQYSVFGHWMVSVRENHIICRKARTDAELISAEELYQNVLLSMYGEDGKWAVDLRKKYWSRVKNKKRPIWLFMDRADRADDNAEILFAYMQAHKEIDSYFVIDDQAKDFSRLSEIGNTVPLYSEEHYLLVLQADYIISSQCNGVIENPFWEKAEYFRDLYHKPKIIFLQHGVIKDDMSPTLNRFNTNFTGFITSTEDEYHSILEYPYYYTQKEVWRTGLPLFDKLKNDPQKVILVMPTWRQEIMEQQWDEEQGNMLWVPRENWKKSEYFQRYYELFHSKSLQKACEKKGYKMVFKPHPLIEPYAAEFVEGSEVQIWGKTVSYQEAFAKGSLLLTDYSSVAFEFGYLRKPILYYQFDRSHFFQNHTYKEGYFEYKKDAFGRIEKNGRSIIRAIKKNVKNGCLLQEKYQNKLAYLYDGINGESCKKIYERICSVNKGDYDGTV